MPSLGIQHNNYLNLKQGSTPWLDAGGKDSGRDSKGHAIFTNPAYGIRAGIIQLRSYFFRHNRKTIAEILERWAPVTDTIGSLPGAPPNSPREYSIYVAGRMGISYNQRLEIFDDDQTIGNISQLRELFFAMAAYEVGDGFKVPTGEFNAGLELVEPGIRILGTDSHATNTALSGVTTRWRIGGSVGRWEENASNEESDVATIQQMLRQASLILHEPAYDPGGVDGKIAPPGKKSPTVNAIKAFQGRFMIRPDGLIEPEGRSWRELLRILTVGGPGENAGPAGTGEFFFPFASIPSVGWTGSPRGYAASRDHGARAHAGCDLYFPKGTVIHAITGGTVLRGPEPFYAGTFALEIDHGTFIARYGEIQQTTLVRKGDRVTPGQPIAKVGHLIGIDVPSDMLHLELYDKSADGPLTVPGATGAMTSSGVPFLRRRDLIDPTPKLDEWQHNLPAATSGTGSPTLVVAGVPSTGFCIHLKRIRQETRATAGFSRTVGDYQCYWNGTKINGLAGQIVERGGPGDNTTAIGNNRDRRIRAGTYPLAIQDGTNYKTYGYTNDENIPKPGLLLKRTEERTAILLHPGKNYISSIGCLNPASGLTDARSQINFQNSRSQVIAIIDAMQTKMGAGFPKAGTIPDAVILIEGEP